MPSAAAGACSRLRLVLEVLTAPPVQQPQRYQQKGRTRIEPLSNGLAHKIQVQKTRLQGRHPMRYPLPQEHAELGFPERMEPVTSCQLIVSGKNITVVSLDKHNCNKLACGDHTCHQQPLKACPCCLLPCHLCLDVQSESDVHLHDLAGLAAHMGVWNVLVLCDVFLCQSPSCCLADEQHLI